MKKSIVLLISLFFIAAVSLLIIQNLKDTDSYINEQNSKFTKTQIMFLLNNAKDEVSKILSKNQENDISSYLDIDYPIVVKDAKIIVKLKEYDKYNINLLKSKDEKDYESIKKFFEDNSVYDIETFRYLMKDKQDIKNYKQLDDLLVTVTKESSDKRILDLKNYLGFIKFDKKDTDTNDEKKEILFYELFVKVDYIKQFAKAYYILNKNGGVEYFELSFK
ncbi:hypothetical protein AVENP_2502 [Arcobacter venerupis]|uniref:Uncharacterized protein n=1 Tax=Arcobacter venerupis TaxID=1054033 RepID=A0AAE7E5N4_9BACT|nr:hypothetical protein [Arcobacter venerupis]QKF68006.1 hypothetical protein AVENP_2502 [Arcobacter venerupis]RWS48282.1 hypothetical protein CKA56_14565 [Arcobacter venerupis]